MKSQNVKGFSRQGEHKGRAKEAEKASVGEKTSSGRSRKDYGEIQTDHGAGARGGKK